MGNGLKAIKSEMAIVTEGGRLCKVLQDVLDTELIPEKTECNKNISKLEYILALAKLQESSSPIGRSSIQNRIDYVCDSIECDLGLGEDNDYFFGIDLAPPSTVN